MSKKSAIYIPTLYHGRGWARGRVPPQRNKEPHNSLLTFGEASALIASAHGITSKPKKANSSNHVPP
eukprot:2063127-Prymnesium_polylepis.1